MICSTTGKDSLSRSDAVDRVRRLVETDKKDPEIDKLRAYRCRHCNRWHIGHRFSSVRRRINA